MKKILYLSCILILLSSCLTVKMSDLKPHPKNSSLLPALEPRIDMNSFESAYSIGYSTGTSTGYGAEITQNIGVGFTVNNNRITKDQRVQDAITIFDREVKNNITYPYGEKKGYILCKIAAGSSKLSGLGWSVLSGLTLTIPNFFGMPFGTYTTDLDIEVEIYDLKNNLVQKYNAQGFFKSIIAMYYGYCDIGSFPSPAARISNINAFKSAMNDIKGQIEKDYNILMKRLNK